MPILLGGEAANASCARDPKGKALRGSYPNTLKGRLLIPPMPRIPRRMRLQMLPLPKIPRGKQLRPPIPTLLRGRWKLMPTQSPLGPPGVTLLPIHKAVCTMPQPVHNPVVIRCVIAGAIQLCLAALFHVEGHLFSLSLCPDVGDVLGKPHPDISLVAASEVALLGVEVLAISVARARLHHTAHRRHIMASGSKKHCL